MANIQIHPQILVKLASFMERLPTAIAEIEKTSKKASVSTAPSASLQKEAAACSANLVKYAGLDSARQADFAKFLVTPEGAIKAIGSLTNKIAGLQAEIAQARNLAVGVPSSSYKTSSHSGVNASSAWCEALLG